MTIPSFLILCPFVTRKQLLKFSNQFSTMSSSTLNNLGRMWSSFIHISIRNIHIPFSHSYLKLQPPAQSQRHMALYFLEDLQLLLTALHPLSPAAMLANYSSLKSWAACICASLILECKSLLMTSIFVCA